MKTYLLHNSKQRFDEFLIFNYKKNFEEEIDNELINNGNDQYGAGIYFLVADKDNLEKQKLESLVFGGKYIYEVVIDNEDESFNLQNKEIIDLIEDEERLEDYKRAIQEVYNEILRLHNLKEESLNDLIYFLEENWEQLLDDGLTVNKLNKIIKDEFNLGFTVDEYYNKTLSENPEFFDFEDTIRISYIDATPYNFIGRETTIEDEFQHCLNISDNEAEFLKNLYSSFAVFSSSGSFLYNSYGYVFTKKISQYVSDIGGYFDNDNKFYVMVNTDKCNINKIYEFDNDKEEINIIYNSKTKKKNNTMRI